MRIPDCHPDRPHRSNGLCASCYNHSVYKPSVTGRRQRSMAECHPDRLVKAHGLCNACYIKLTRTPEFQPKKKRIPECHPDRPHSAKGLCGACYQSGHYKATGWKPRQSECGHEPHMANGLCRVCYGKTKYLADPEAAKEKSRKWRAENPERFEATRRDHNFRRRYGITALEADAMFVAQGGVCWICRLVPKKRCIDHDHTTGVVRGILCDRCNVGLGGFRDNLALLYMAAAYLERFAGASIRKDGSPTPRRQKVAKP